MYKTTKKFVSLPTEKFKTSTFLGYKVKKGLNQKKTKTKKKRKEKLNITLKSVYKTVEKLHYFHHRIFQNLHVQPLSRNNPNLFTAFYLRLLDHERFYKKILTRQICKKSLCYLPPNLNKF